MNLSRVQISIYQHVRRNRKTCIRGIDRHLGLQAPYLNEYKYKMHSKIQTIF